MTAPLAAFLLVFGVVALLEFFDRTTFAVIGLATRQPFRPTWLGAAAAFVLTSALAVIVGTTILVALHGSFRYFQIGGGALLLAYAGYLWFFEGKERPLPSGRSAFATAFATILLLELGDATMIVIVLFAGSLAQPLAVFVGGSAALLTVATVTASLGGWLGARVPPKVLDRAVIVVMLLVGALTILFALEPGLLPPVFG
ncbi:MAG: TMEM165/GDT1 family protein [Thermoplasmata archaeon]|nr:TMEM165/GDT1 family protein [Thermoplasmata archaeon]